MTTGDWLCKRLWNLFFLYDFTPNLASKTSYQMNGNPPTPLHWIRWLCALMGAKWRGTRNAHENIKQGSTNSCPSMCPMSNLISHFYLYFFTKPHWLITKHIYKWSEGPLRNKCYIWACDPPPKRPSYWLWRWPPKAYLTTSCKSMLACAPTTPIPCQIHCSFWALL